MKGPSLRWSAAAVLAVLTLVWLSVPEARSQAADFPITGGWFFTQTGGDTADPLDGYAVIDDQQALFWTAFGEAGGIAAVGYPVTRRFVWDGFVTQVFQKAAFQWRADTGEVQFINVFDDLSRLGFDDALESRLIPRQERFDEEGLDFDEIAARRIALLDVEPALRAGYQSVEDPLRWYGLPQSRVREFGNGLLRSIRLQRAVLQLWTEDVPWASAGTVTVANGGEEAKALGLWPADAVRPEPPPDPATASAVDAPSGTGSATLLWEHPLPESDYPYSRYRVLLAEGVAIVRVGDSEIRALDANSGRILWSVADERVLSDFSYQVADGVVYLKKYSEPGRSEIYANRGLTPTTDIVALDIRSGAKIWQFWEAESRSYQRIHIWRNILAIESDPRIGLDLRTGQKLWESRVPGFANYATAGVIIFERLGLVTALDLASGAVIWQKTLTGLSQFQGASSGNAFARAGDSIVAIDARTGESAWSYRVPGKNLSIHFMYDGFVLVQSNVPPPPSPYPTFTDPDGFCVLEPTSGTPLWCREFAGRSVSVGSGVGGLRLESEDRVSLLDVSTGVELWGVDKASDGVQRNPQFIRRAGVIYEVVGGDFAAFAEDSHSRLWQYSWNWEDDPDQWRDDPLLMAAADNMAIIWTGAGLAAIGIA